MTVRTKTFIIITVAMALLMSAVFSITGRILLGEADRNDRGRAMQDVQRAGAALKYEIARLSVQTTDYAGWDESYSFIAGDNPEFVESNLSDETFSRNRFGFMIYADLSGRIAYSKAFDIDEGVETSLPEGLRDHLTPGSLLTQHRSIESKVEGVLDLPGGPVLLASRPILTSQYQGPIRGTLIIGKPITASEVERLAALTQMPLSVCRLEDPGLPEDIGAALSESADDNPIVTRLHGDNALAAYGSIGDIYGKPKLALAASFPRIFRNQTVKTLATLIPVLVGISITLCLVLLFIVDKFVISRISVMREFFRDIRSFENLPRRLNVNGNDELSDLGKTINRMLEALELDEQERRLAEEAMRESEAKYSVLFHNELLAICIIDPQSLEFIDVNAAFLKLYGYEREEILTEALVSDISAEPEKTVETLKDSGVSGTLSIPLRFHCKKDGTRFPVEIVTVAHRWKNKRVVFELIRDIGERIQAEEERERLESQLLHSQKMEAVGTLAGGIAHDFNNILGIVIGFAEVLLSDLGDDHEARSDVKMLMRAAHRGKDLIKRILAFSRLETARELVPIALDKAVTDTIQLLRATLPATIEIRLTTPETSALTLADPTQIHQVLVNLCTNAVQAMSDTGGALEISLTEADSSSIDSPVIPEFRPGKYYKLSVIDNGHGMDAETLKRIFDPYFTTKEVGKGSGLGLALVHGIVKYHGGAVTVQSEPGKGTTFNVYLPRIKTPDTEGDETPIPAFHGGARILLVDDERQLAEAWMRILEQLGHQVTVTNSASEAVDVFRANPKLFDLVITDYTMPRMTGEQLAGKILEIRPDIPIVLCTGYNESITEERAKSLGISEFLMKPLNQSDFARTIPRLLAGRDRRRQSAGAEA